jgi:hypothetical protein
VWLGDADAFERKADDAFSIARREYDAICVVHPALAMMAAVGSMWTPQINWQPKRVILFENGSRPQEGGPPSFTPVALHIYQLRGIDDGQTTYTHEVVQM